MEQIKKFLHSKAEQLQKSGCSAFLCVFFAPLHKLPAAVPH